ncbi:MAG TPA: serine/threonine-protein kinase, partial [Blastocatellia bacterium]|nr:serine/threonine-protein kinase [Blastocatellia bacterium]
MKKIEELFETALAVETDCRAAFISEMCNGDEELRAEVQSLIASHASGAGFFATPAFDKAIKLLGEESDESVSGSRIGAYEIIREIGRGGMGTVYLAGRADDQYKKQVAIKLVRQGFDSPSIIPRFLAERQILANLDHKNIGRLLDGGATEDGSPYLVMEHIKGLPVDEYCDKRKMSTVDRLKLFRIVCSAVAYAHQNLVIHRDIKPSNILVTEDGTPKLLDFGIAKILSPESAVDTSQTATAGRLMTPDYASPEQVRGQAITTSSDIYSLGVLLYKLLTGHRPYSFKTPLPQEIERVICDQEPEKPSEAVIGRRGHAETEGYQRNRRSTIANRQLRGDLDNIVMKAMRKEPARRYSSVEQLSEDIRRHLE